jgi:hypothetical protein
MEVTGIASSRTRAWRCDTLDILPTTMRVGPEVNSGCCMEVVKGDRPAA